MTSAETRFDQLTDPADARFEALLALYRTAIPLRERKPDAEVRAMAASPIHRVTAAMLGEKLVGFSLLYVGSPSSKENDDRLEAKVDALLRINGGEAADRLIAELDDHYMRDHGHAKPHGHESELVRRAGHGVRHVASGE